MRPRRRTVAGMRRDSAGIRDDAVVLRSSDVAGMRRWTRLWRQQVVLSEKAVQRGAVDPKGAGTYRGSGSNRSSAPRAPPPPRCQMTKSSPDPGPYLLFADGPLRTGRICG